jgi:hypothetical protein
MFYGRCSIRYDYIVFPTSELASRCADSLQYILHLLRSVMLGKEMVAGQRMFIYIIYVCFRALSFNSYFMSF